MDKYGHVKPTFEIKTDTRYNKYACLYDLRTHYVIRYDDKTEKSIYNIEINPGFELMNKRNLWTFFILYTSIKK